VARAIVQQKTRIKNMIFFNWIDGLALQSIRQLWICNVSAFYGSLEPPGLLGQGFRRNVNGRLSNEAGKWHRVGQEMGMEK
jgi:hypothetical protein